MFEVIQCNGTIISFCTIVCNKSCRNISSLENVKKLKSNSIVVAEFLEYIIVRPNQIIAIFREVLPNLEYGEKFKAVLKDPFVIHIRHLPSLDTGDFFAFSEPDIFLSPSFDDKQPKYLLETGCDSTASVWYYKRKTSPLNIDQGDEWGMEINESFFNADQITFKIKAFLVKVYPNPSVNVFGLVSGFCLSGCKLMFDHSKVIWHEFPEVAYCPKCFNTEPKMVREVQMMFAMKLRVLCVPGGRNITVLAKGHQAEHFLECSVLDYMTDHKIRERVVKLFTNKLLILGRKPGSSIERMELTLSIKDNMAHLVDSKRQMAYKTPLLEFILQNS